MAGKVSCLDLPVNMFSFLSLEPAVFLVQFGRYALEGAQIQTDLLMWKICHLEKNYSESICSNLTLDEYDDINTEVQTRANNILMVMQWIHSGNIIAHCFALDEKCSRSISPLKNRFQGCQGYPGIRNYPKNMKVSLEILIE